MVRSSLNQPEMLTLLLTGPVFFFLSWIHYPLPKISSACQKTKQKKKNKITILIWCMLKYWPTFTKQTSSTHVEYVLFAVSLTSPLSHQQGLRCFSQKMQVRGAVLPWIYMAIYKSDLFLSWSWLEVSDRQSILLCTPPTPHSGAVPPLHRLPCWHFLERRVRCQQQYVSFHIVTFSQWRG